MPSVPHPPPYAEHAAVEPALLRALLDDCSAVAGPAAREAGTSSQLAGQVGDHLARGAEAFGDLVASLVLTASQVEEFRRVKRSHPVRVMLDATAVPLATAQQSLAALTADSTVTVTGLAVAWDQRWPEATSWGVPLSVRLPERARQGEAIEDIADHAAAQSAVQALLPLGPAAGWSTAASTSTSTTTSPSVTGPTATELAEAMRRCVDLDLGFALGGGLAGVERAVSASTTSGAVSLGALNVLAATRYALAHAAEVPQLAALLTHHDSHAVVHIVTRMSQADVAVVRAFCTSLSTPDVVAVARGLASLGLIPPVD